MEIVGKLTAKSLGWDRNVIGAAVADTTHRVAMGRIVGIATGLRQTVNNDTGDISTGLKGNFKGVSTRNILELAKNEDGSDRMIDGKPQYNDTGRKIEVRSGVCYLPAGLQDMIEGSLAKAQEDDPKATVSFALDLFCIKDTNKAGYTFRAETLVAAEERDPLDMLLEQAATAALPAPADEAETVDADAEAPKGRKTAAK